MKLGLILIGMSVIGVLTVAGPSAISGPALAQNAGQMTLNASGPGVACDAPTDPNACTVPVGGNFTLAVEAHGVSDYIGIESHVVYGGLKYNPAATDEEIVWPNLGGLIVRSPGSPLGTEGFVKHGGGTSNTPPFPPSDFEGTFVQVSLTCSAEPQAFEIFLIPYSDTQPNGSGWILAPGSVVAPTVVGQAGVDTNRDGVAETVDVAGKLTINCGAGGPGPSTSGPSTPGRPTSGTTTPPPPAGASGTEEARRTGTPTARGGPSEDDGGSNARLWIAVGVIAAAVVAGGAGGGWWYLRRRRAG